MPSAALGTRDRITLPLRVHLRLASCRNLLMRDARRSVERWGLTLPQFDILAELERAARTGFTFGELSRLLLVTSGNLTGIVDRLEADGLARRKNDSRDRRVVRILLTRKGRQLVQQITPLHAKDIQASLAFMPAERLNLLHSLLTDVSDGLQDRSPADKLARTVEAQGRRRGRGLKPIPRKRPALAPVDGEGDNTH